MLRSECASSLCISGSCSSTSAGTGVSRWLACRSRGRFSVRFSVGRGVLVSVRVGVLARLPEARQLAPAAPPVL